MKKQGPGFREYIKTRYKHPLKPRSYLTFTSKSGDKFRDAGSPHTKMINITATLLIGITILFLNCTVWYVLLCAVIVLLLYHFRYYWTNFKRGEADWNFVKGGSVLPDQTNASQEAGHTQYTRKQKVFIAVEIVLMLAAAPGAYFLCTGSDYARPTQDNIIETGEVHVYPHEQNVENLAQAYECARGWALKNAPEAVITHYGMEVSGKGVFYRFVFMNKTPGIFIKRTHEFEIMSAAIEQTNYGLLYFSYCLYDSELSSFNAVNPPEADIDAEKVIDILYEKADIDREDAEYFYIATGFWTDLPGPSDPGGDTWAVGIKTGGRILYYTVNVSRGTAVLEREEKADEAS